MVVRVTTYNLLSTKLANPDYHIHCESKYLATEYRWEIIKSQLSSEILFSSIICLQEVSTEWLEKLTPFLHSNKYAIVGGTYGLFQSDGDMGVFIAYPYDVYTLEELRQIKPGREIKKYTKKLKKAQSERLKSFLFWLISSIFNLIPRFIPFKENLINLISKREDTWQKAINKDNLLVLCRFKQKTDSKGSFCIGTYHMPCNFTNPSLMLIHSSMACKLLAKFADTNPYVFAGDFNLKPCDPGYKMITEGGSNYNQLVDQSSNFEVKLVVGLDQPLFSAYKLAKGKEPTFTNYSFCKSNNQFKDCIDYIFCSQGWAVQSVSDLQEVALGDAYPSAYHPSDHLMISAELMLGGNPPKN